MCFVPLNQRVLLRFVKKSVKTLGLFSSEEDASEPIEWYEIVEIAADCVVVNSGLVGKTVSVHRANVETLKLNEETFYIANERQIIGYEQ